MKKILLLLILVLGLFGVESEEVGVPYIEIDQSSKYDAVLAPDGESFFTLKGDLVTQWQLSPFKKLFSFKTGIEEFGPPVYQISISSDNQTVGGRSGADSRYKISASNDGQRIILYSPKTNEIQLWDVKTMKHLKTIKEDLQLGTGTKYGFVSITKDNQIHIRNDKDLSLIKDMDTTLTECTYRVSDDESAVGKCRAFGITNGDNLLSISYSDRGLFIDLDTLEIVDTFFAGLYPYSVKHRIAGGKYADKFVGKIAQRRANRQVTDNPKVFEHTFSSLRKLNKIEGRKVGVLALTYMMNQYFFVDSSFDESGKEEYKSLYHFYQFEDEWVFLDYRKGFFTGSENIRKYLKMKTKDGKIVPMNDATFEKYNRLLS